MITDREHQQAVSTLVTARDCLRWGESALRRSDVFLGHGTDDPWDEALSLLLHVLALPWDSDPRLLDARLLPLEVEEFVELMRRRVNERVPSPYLTGSAWFAGLEFEIDERVLIPRSPVAELIESGFEPQLRADGLHRVLDLCTGSGCIAIACAMALPHARIDASDISDDALAVAAANVARYGLEDQVTLLAGDGLAAASGQYDLIITNPPYVDAEDMADRPAEFCHEPSLALASGEDGLDFTRVLLARAADYLTEAGALICEVGDSRLALEALFPQVPFFWFAFERGGDGVFMLDRAQLLAHRKDFEAALGTAAKSG